MDEDAPIGIRLQEGALQLIDPRRIVIELPVHPFVRFPAAVEHSPEVRVLDLQSIQERPVGFMAEGALPGGGGALTHVHPKL